MRADINPFSTNMMLQQYRRLKRLRSKVGKQKIIYSAILLEGAAMLYSKFTLA